MVGLVIGMIGVVVMMQIFSVSEGYKRTTTGGDDAQNNGAIGLYGLQRDVRMSGQGASSFTDNAASTTAYSLVGCNVTLRAGVTINALGPVTINHASIPAGDANTDTLLIFYGNGDDGPEGDRIESQPATNTYTLAGFLTTGGTPSGVRSRLSRLLPNQFAIAIKLICLPLGREARVRVVDVRGITKAGPSHKTAYQE